MRPVGVGEDHLDAGKAGERGVKRLIRRDHRKVDIVDEFETAAMEPVQHWVFDLDNTLYSAQCRLFHQIDRRMGEFVAGLLGLAYEDARRLQKKYFHTYGTTLRGLMKHHQVDPNYGPVVEMVTDGPYRFGRNPLYLALSIALLGIGLAGNTYWTLLLLPVAVAYMHYGVILPEERHLEKLFGDEYLAYKSRVRRWI